MYLRGWCLHAGLAVACFVVLMTVGLCALGRTGAWVDEVIITVEEDPSVAIDSLQAGVSDIYAALVTDTDLYRRVLEDRGLTFRAVVYGSSDLRLNCHGPEFEDGRLNPFYSQKVREALNWLLDRHHIADEILGGLGYPKWTQFGTTFPEQVERYPDMIAEIEEHYAYDFDRANRQIAAGMRELGARQIGGQYYYNGEPVKIIIANRTDLPPYPEAGDYVAEQLRTVGFEVEVIYSTAREQAVLRGRPMGEGAAQLFTGGWRMPGVSRTEVHSWDQFYTHRVMPIGLWTHLEDVIVNFPEFDEAQLALKYSDYSTMEERKALVEIASWGALEMSSSIWIVEPLGFVPHVADLAVAIDAASGISEQWPFTLHWHEEGEPVVGGTVNMQANRMFVEPWNPVDGSPFTYDMMVTRDALGEGYTGHMTHPETGLNHPLLYERAEVYMREGLPVTVTEDHLELYFEEEIVVPDHAWADWDHEEQQFLTAADRAANDPNYEQVALRKSVVFYPDDYFDRPLHDGSTYSIADHILADIFTYERGRKDGLLYDPAVAPSFEASFLYFKGVIVYHEDTPFGAHESGAPLVVEYYSDAWSLDAEQAVTTWAPTYGTYNWFGFWHKIAVGKMAAVDGELAFTEDRAEQLGVEWMDYTRGPSLPVLENYLQRAIQTNYIPYAPTLGQYITPAEARERWSNLDAFFQEYGHFWVGNGPFRIKELDDGATKYVHLVRFEDYPDPADRWLHHVSSGEPLRLPQAAFTFSPDEPEVATFVRFTDASLTSDERVVSRHWDFGDGRSSTIQNPSHRYTSAGTYTVKLTVTDDHGGTDTTTRRITVAARPPQAAFTFSPNEPGIDQTVRFTDTSTAPDGRVVRRRWEFGDGGLSTTQSPTHRYRSAGTYTVKLTVTDDHGNTDTTTRRITVARRPPQAAFTFSPDVPEIDGLVRFRDTSTAPDGHMVSRHWEFGDGRSSTIQNPSHRYTNAGTYTVKLTVTDNHGASDTTTRRITVAGGPPQAAFTFSPDDPRVGQTVRFTDTSTAPDGRVVSRHWEFGDGRSSTAQNPPLRYTNAGTYTVKLTVTDNHGASDTTTRRITVAGGPPQAAFTYEPHTKEEQLFVNKEVTFDGSESRAPDGDIVRYAWDFGEGHTAEGKLVTHTYTEPGAYTVKLTVWDAHAATDTAERELQVVKGGSGGPS